MESSFGGKSTYWFTIKFYTTALAKLKCWSHRTILFLMNHPAIKEYTHETCFIKFSAANFSQEKRKSKFRDILTWNSEIFWHAIPKDMVVGDKVEGEMVVAGAKGVGLRQVLPHVPLHRAQVLKLIRRKVNWKLFDKIRCKGQITYTCTIYIYSNFGILHKLIFYKKF